MTFFFLSSVLVTQKKDKLDFLLFDPDSNLKSIWDILNFIFILYQTIAVPFRLCFGADSTGKIANFESFIDVFFIIDFFT